MVRTSTSAIFTLVLALSLSGSAAAAVQSKCVASKNKCMSKKAGGLLKCEQKAETPGLSTDPNFGSCVDKAKAKFDGSPDPSKGCFEKLENKAGNDCITVNDTASAENAVDDCVDQLVAAIDPGSVTQSKCGVGKKKCVAKKLKSMLKCYQKAQTPFKDPNANANGCIDKAKAKFDGGTNAANGCFVKLENKAGNDCQPPTGNQAALEDIVDSCVAAFVNIIENPTTTTTSTSTTSSTSTSTSSTSTTSTSTSSTTTTSTSSTTTTSTSTTSTTSTSTSSTSTSSTSTSSTTSSSTTTTLPTLTTLDFITSTPGGNCGTSKDGSSVTIKNLTCGGLNIGGGGSIVPEGPTPDGSINRYSLSCSGASCTVGATNTAPPVNTAGPDCTNTGCNFGTPLPIPNPTIPNITTCVLNAFASPGTGTINRLTGVASLNVNLNSDIYLTGNLAQPCPKCSATGTPSSPGSGTCDRGPRATLACKTTSSTGITRDCPTGGTDGTHPCTPGGGQCIDGSHVGVINVNLTPLTTGTASSTNATGAFCPGQAGAPSGHAGCFGSTACRTITENGMAPGALSPAVPASGKLASTFCIASTGNGLVDASADLPGPGAVALPGTFTAN